MVAFTTMVKCETDHTFGVLIGQVGPRIGKLKLRKGIQRMTEYDMDIDFCQMLQAPYIHNLYFKPFKQEFPI